MRKTFEIPLDIPEVTIQHVETDRHGDFVITVKSTVEGAQLRVRGQGQNKQGSKASIDPGESEVQEMVETVLTPPHPDPFEALLDEPFAGPLHHSRAQRQVQILVPGIVDMRAMPFQVRRDGAYGLPCGGRQPLHVQGVRQVGQDPLCVAMAWAVPCPDEPPTRIARASIQPGGCPLPQLLHRVVKIQNPYGMASEARLKQPPHPSAPITEPDDLRRMPDALAQRFKPQTLLERREITENGHQPALMQARHELPGPGAMATQASEDAHFDLVPGRCAPGLAALGAKRHHHPIGPSQQGRRDQFGRQRLLGGLLALGDGLPLLVELRHGPVSSRLHPTPYGTRADGAATLPAQQPGSERTRDKDRQGTPEGLAVTTRPLLRLHTQRVVQGSSLRDGTALRAAADPALPPDGPKEAHHLALSQPFTP